MGKHLRSQRNSLVCQTGQTNFLAMLDSQTCRDLVVRGLNALAESDDAETCYKNGLKAHSRGDIIAALAWYEKALAREPEHRDAIYNSALCHLPDPREMKRLGPAYEEGEWEEKAENFVRRALKIDLARNSTKGSEWNLVQDYTTLGAALLGRDLPEQAVTALEAAIEHGGASVAHYDMGLAKERLGLYDQAREYYENSVFMDPGHALAILQLACLLDYLGEKEEAITNFQAFLNVHKPTDPYVEEHDLSHARTRMNELAAEIEEELVEVCEDE